jgi:hypothetical protein
VSPAGMLDHNASVPADYDAIRIGVNINRTPDRTAVTEYLLLSKLTMAAGLGEGPIEHAGPFSEGEVRGDGFTSITGK